MRKKLELSGKFVILYVGAMRRIKRTTELVKAVGVAIKTKPTKEITLLLVGPEPEKGSFGADSSISNEVKEIIRIDHLDDDIKILGSISFEDLKLIYNSADLLILPSLAECCPAVVLEAMAFEIPVLATYEAGGALIKNWWNGLLIPQSDENRIAEGILCLMNSNDAMFEAMRQNARSFVIRNHNWKLIAENLAKVYANALAKS